MINTWVGNFLEEKPVRYFEQHHPYVPKKQTIVVRKKEKLVFRSEIDNIPTIYFISL